VHHFRLRRAPAFTFSSWSRTASPEPQPPPTNHCLPASDTWQSLFQASFIGRSRCW